MNNAQFDAVKASFDHWINSSPDKIILRRREIQYLAGGGSKGGSKGPPERTAIKGFTPCSGGRLRRYVDNYHANFCGMVTLTYGEAWPRDGKIVKKQLSAWFERVRRLGYFDKHSLVWWLEFQERGAPHIHMVITGWISRRWVAQSWADITKGVEEACTRVESLRNPDAAGSYAAKYAAKGDQKEVPDGFINVGRFWGRRGWVPETGAVPKTVAASMIEARSPLRAWAGSQARARDAQAQARRAGTGVPSETESGRTIGVFCENRYLSSIRVYEHEGGWSIYGNEREVQWIWGILQDINVITSQTGLRQDGSKRTM